MTPVTFFRRKQRLMLLTLLGLLGSYAIASVALGFQQGALLQVQTGFVWMAHNFLPTTTSLSLLPAILFQLWRTFVVAAAAAGVAGVISLLLAVVAAGNIGQRHVGVSFLIRGMASILRNIPIIAWALILLFSFKQNELTGFLALWVMNLGFLTRAFLETIEDFDAGKLEALVATGTAYPVAIMQGLLPEIATPVVEWLLYMIENNVRDATLVGLLTGTGIGFSFDLYFKSINYPAAGLVVVVLIVLVISLELLSTHIQRSLR
ncbi:ABC transporter permease subunit [Lacticaseibacillus sp. N501-2]|uniref:ABC transporter permease subunit n=1 Tax=Lacticaseibacillus salsurae TaxID=3367729 RepID=UPI0038B407C8